MSSPIRNRAQNVLSWRIDELALILLRQFKRLLGDHGVEWLDADLKALAERASERRLSDGDSAVIAALREIVSKSEDVLGTWGLTYAQSLDTGMDDMPDWESTADFLALANEKVNAELRISAGASLLLVLGDSTYAHHAQATADHGEGDPEDVDAVIARRALDFAANPAKE